jgi:acyl carrier protein
MQVQNSSMSNQTVIENWLVKQLAEQLSLDSQAISISEPLTRYGLDSIDAVTMVGDLEDALDTELPSTLFWDYPTIEKSAQFLAENYDVSAIAAESTSQPVEAKVSESTPEPVTNGKGWGGLFSRIKGA